MNLLNNNMIPFPFIFFPCYLETATTVEAEKEVWNDYYTEIVEPRQFLNYLEMGGLKTIKNNKLTTVTFDTDVKTTNTSGEVYQDSLSGNYDIHIPIIINKSFHFKGKVRSITRFNISINI
jgi:hypothetical protein